MSLDPLTLVALLGMTAVSMICRFGGYWLFTRMPPNRTLRDGLSYVPACVFAATAAPFLANGGAQEWVGAIITVLVMARTRSFPLATICGLAACWGVWELPAGGLR